jgi:low affinity Fe/Cu permease
MLKVNFCSIAVSASNALGSPACIILFPIVCVLYLWFGGSVDVLTLILSVLAISMSSLILLAQNLETEANKLQIAELIRAIPGARDELAELEGFSHEELQDLKEPNGENS